VRGARGVLLVLATASVLVGCGVEVPDEVATATAPSTEPAASTTTAPPMSDDEIEQALLDNGYSLAEARCGAENLREQLPDSQIEEVLRSDDIEDIRESTADAFADALQPCLDQ
jgi:hypothetical protein